LLYFVQFWVFYGIAYSDKESCRCLVRFSCAASMFKFDRQVWRLVFEWRNLPRATGRSPLPVRFQSTLLCAGCFVLQQHMSLIVHLCLIATAMLHRLIARFGSRNFLPECHHDSCRLCFIELLSVDLMATVLPYGPA
jgi:hypothetical protein